MQADSALIARKSSIACFLQDIQMVEVNPPSFRVSLLMRSIEKASPRRYVIMGRVTKLPVSGNQTMAHCILSMALWRRPTGGTLCENGLDHR